MQILLIEDEKRVADFICRGLKSEGFFCEQANNGVSGLAMIKHSRYDLLIIDRMLPDIDGLTVCNLVRKDDADIPILFLTAVDDTQEKVNGLRAGADDYLTKPFDFEELIARIEALGRRRQQNKPSNNTLQVGPLEIKVDERSVSIADQAIELTSLEFDLLLYLIQTDGKVVSRERIINAVWGVNSDPLTNIVDVYIRRLRKKIDTDADASLIETKRGVGYRFSGK
ncbi:MAG TPA: response regulator transcription factor [Methylophaga aminisulfidivorans]|uniref:Response regulator transcription factor n=2 Tax=root TaxID=1 RepID=A0A7C1VRW5_9GAMM|nr:response regulator transcription factor [Methylophaga aminisulfidivorans]